MSMKNVIWFLFLLGSTVVCSCEKDDDFSDPITMPDQMPSFPGGVYKLYEYIYANIKYPPEARENGIKGTVIATFVISKSGRLGDIVTLTNLGFGLEEEVVRLLTQMSQEIRWVPGTINGQNVSVKFTLPIEFVL